MRHLRIPEIGSTHRGQSLVSFAYFVIQRHTHNGIDLKEWLDTHGIPAPQPTTRDKLIASVRRNSRVASLKAADAAASASASAAAAAETMSEKLLNAWSDSRRLLGHSKYHG